MSLLQNLTFAGMLATGTAMYTGNLSQEDLNDFILEVNKQQGDPYERVVELLPQENKYEKEFISFNEIVMADINNWRDDEFLAKLLYTERSRPKDEKELRAIAATVIHRALMHGQTIKEACTNKKQYSGVMRWKNKHWLKDPSRIHKQVAYSMLKEYQEAIPTGLERMYFFCNMKTVKKHNPRAFKWFVTLDKLGTHTSYSGTHTFFSSDRWDEWLRKNPSPKLEEKHFNNFNV